MGGSDAGGWTERYRAGPDRDRGSPARIHPEPCGSHPAGAPTGRVLGALPDAAGLQRALDILGEIAQVAAPPRGDFSLSGETDVIQAVIGVITRHPMREADLRHALQDWKPNQVDNALATLALSGQAQVVERNGERFWCVAEAYYAEARPFPRVKYLRPGPRAG